MTKDSGERLLERTESSIPTSSPALAPELNPAPYVNHLTNVDLTDTQKQEFLETLWDIMRRFVELGFEIDVCDMLLSDENNAFGPESSGVLLDHSNNTLASRTNAGKGAGSRDE